MSTVYERKRCPPVWARSPRPGDPWPADTKRLRALAEQPKYSRAAKRARSIVQFIDGVRRDQIVRDANVSEASVQKWVDRYFAHGLEGWRAHHSGVSHLAATNPNLQRAIQASVTRARKIVLSPVRKNGSDAKRLHMNGYLQQLVRRFGEHSVDMLAAEVEQRLDVALGTVYIGDLLAIADAVFSHTDTASAAPSVA